MEEIKIIHPNTFFKKSFTILGVGFLVFILSFITKSTFLYITSFFFAAWAMYEIFIANKQSKKYYEDMGKLL